MDDALIYEGGATQGDRPEWRPLLDVAGEAIAGDFMWMFEVELSDGRLLQAYKHIDTRRYVHLDDHGAAFMYLSPNRYVSVPTAEALAAALGTSERD